MLIKHANRLLISLALVLFVWGCGSEKPLADNKSATTLEDTSVVIELSGTSPKELPLTFKVTTPPKFGSISGSPPNITYTPARGFIGPVTFTYVSNSGTLDSDPATVNISVAPNLSRLAEKPAPVFMKMGYPASTTEAHLEWSESVDNATSTSNIDYEVHASSDEDFYPTNETLVQTV